MASKDVLTCATCGRPFPALPYGRPPKYCFEHRDPRNRTRDIENLKKTAKKKGGATRKIAEAVLEAGAANTNGAEGIDRALAPQLLAAALALTDDEQAAAVIAGLGHLDPEELERNLEIARVAHRDLTEGSVSATVRVASSVVPLIVLRAVVNSTRVSPSAAAQAARSLGQMIEALSGGPKPVYSGPITIEIDAGPKNGGGT